MAASLAIAACLSGPVAAGDELAPKAYDVVRLAEGVHGIVWREPLRDPIEGNALIVINDEDVLVVDTALFPSTARRMAAEVQKLTRKPVRYVVNTHWHDDHHGGNQVYRELWPGVQFISHRHTRGDAIEQSHDPRPQNIERLRKTIPDLERWLETGEDDDGKAIDDARRERIENAIVFYRTAIEELESIEATPADLTFEDAIVLHRGDRTIEIRWLGLANTRGDVVVHLPRERIVATGDIIVHPIPFGFGSYYSDWIETLARIDGLGADVILPGHGEVQRDNDYLRRLQALLRDLVEQVDATVAEGATLEETQARVSLADWKERFAGDDDLKQRSFAAFWVTPAVERAWRQAMGEPDTQKVN
jgi:glyoxylase-like metal-dependent hydrolase (beta-lactamase superfamily II)